NGGDSPENTILGAPGRALPWSRLLRLDGRIGRTGVRLARVRLARVRVRLAQVRLGRVRSWEDLLADLAPQPSSMLHS
ncbi:MAG: hypothetical protein KAQ78_07975, partial [Candidatus Latescibacteria bacterium]|nr:hypothetical protein [Candidatus Latescibacterota bacterium]